MAGTGLTRGRKTVQRRQILGILREWLIGPLSGVVLAFILEWLSRFVLRHGRTSRETESLSDPILARRSLSDKRRARKKNTHDQ